VSDLLRQLLVDGIGIAAAPWCIIGVILLLSGPRGLPRSIAFLLGASTSMIVIYAVCDAGFGHFGVAAPTSAATGVAWAKLATGLALLAIVFETDAAVAAPFASWRRMSSWNGNWLEPILLISPPCVAITNNSTRLKEPA